MRTSLLLLGCLLVGAWAEEEEKELIMLEIESMSEESGKSVAKRAAQADSPYGQQYVLRSHGQPEPPPQVPGEYLSLLQQLQSQQGVSSQQVHPNDVQQLLVTRTPYQFTSTQTQQPLRPRLSPQAQEQRRIQQEVAQKNIREQEARDAQRQQLRQFYQQQGFPAGAYQLQPQFQQQLQQQLQPQLPTPQPTIQYYQPVAPPQQPQTYYQPEPEQVSYTQVQYGDTRQPASSKPQQLVYQPQPQQIIYKLPTRPTDAPAKSAAPQQYLIETTKPDEQQPVHRPLIYYRPQPDYQAVQGSLLSGQQQIQYSRPQHESPLPPSRSSIFVSKTSLPDQKRVRVPTPQGQRPLTSTELKALVDAGFQVSPQQSENQEYYSPYSVGPQRTYYRGFEGGKRQSKRVPKPVPLSKEERDALAQQGIRNLYTVDTAESRDNPVTYVLALGKPKSS